MAGYGAVGRGREGLGGRAGQQCHAAASMTMTRQGRWVGHRAAVGCPPEAVAGLREDGASGVQRHVRLAVAAVDAQRPVRGGRDQTDCALSLKRRRPTVQPWQQAHRPGALHSALPFRTHVQLPAGQVRLACPARCLTPARGVALWAARCSPIVTAPNRARTRVSKPLTGSWRWTSHCPPLWTARPPAPAGAKATEA